MTTERIKRMMDACYLAQRARSLLPPLPKGVLSSYIQYLDIIQRLEKQGMRVKVSDISGALALPRPGVTRTVKEMTVKGYLTITEAGRKLWETYDGQYFAALQPALEDIPDEDAEAMIRTIEKLYHVMSERRGKL